MKKQTPLLVEKSVNALEVIIMSWFPIFQHFWEIMHMHKRWISDPLPLRVLV